MVNQRQREDLLPFSRLTCLAIAVLFLGTNTPYAPAQARIAQQWSSGALQGIRDAKLGAPVVACALAIVHTCMYDAWATYDERAIGTQLGGALRRPASERTVANKEQAVSYAAYRALVDLLPVDTSSVYIPLMKQLGYDPNDNSTDIETPAGVGNVACAKRASSEKWNAIAIFTQLLALVTVFTMSSINCACAVLPPMIYCRR